MHAVVFTINTSSWINNGRMGRVVVLGEIDAHITSKQTDHSWNMIGEVGRCWTGGADALALKQVPGTNKGKLLGDPQRPYLPGQSLLQRSFPRPEQSKMRGFPT